MNKKSIKIRFFVEYIIVKFLFIILSVLPINIVSNLGGKILKFLGPFSKQHITAIKNYKRIFPNHSKKLRNQNISKSWENIGKNLFEISILKKIDNNKKIIIKGDNEIKLLLKRNQPTIFFGIHQSNWEILVPLIDGLGFPLGAIYRHINNQYIDKIIFRKRTGSLKSNKSFYTPKGKKSAKDILEAIKLKKNVFVLIDQKDSAGDLVNFFNYKVKAQTGFIKIAKKFNMALVPVQNIRNDKTFTVIFHKHFLINDKNILEKEVMGKIHNIVENWIAENPSQWFWQHNRFS